MSSVPGVVVAMAAACMVHVAAADAIKEHGLTDGVSLIIGLSIMSGARFPPPAADDSGRPALHTSYGSDQHLFTCPVATGYQPFCTAVVMWHLASGRCDRKSYI